MNYPNNDYVLIYKWFNVSHNKGGESKRKISSVKQEALQFGLYSDNLELMCLRLINKWNCEGWQYKFVEIRPKE